MVCIRPAVALDVLMYDLLRPVNREGSGQGDVQLSCHGPKQIELTQLTDLMSNQRGILKQNPEQYLKFCIFIIKSFPRWSEH